MQAMSGEAVRWRGPPAPPSLIALEGPAAPLEPEDAAAMLRRASSGAEPRLVLPQDAGTQAAAGSDAGM